MARGFAAAAPVCAAFFLSFPASGFQGPLAENTATSLRRTAPAVPALDQPILRVDSALVTIPARITTIAGVAVNNLRREDFHVFEDDVEQNIVHFGMGDAPVSIGLVFDMSGSMGNKIGKAAEAVKEFFKTANPDDEFFLIKFSDRVKLAVPFTPDPETVYREVARTTPFGETALLDAIHTAVKQMKKARHARKALLIVSDGGDNWSRHSIREIKNGLIEADVQVFAMGIFDWNYLTKHALEERRGPILLTELAEQTGGRHYPVEHLDDLPSISARISREMRNQNELGYYSTNAARDGKYRRVKLTLTDASAEGERLHADYRRGYYAPAR